MGRVQALQQQPLCIGTSTRAAAGALQTWDGDGIAEESVSSGGPMLLLWRAAPPTSWSACSSACMVVQPEEAEQLEEERETSASIHSSCTATWKRLVT